MTIAAPVALEGSARYGVIVGISLSSLLKAPGAPSGQSGIGSLTSARETRLKTRRAVRVEIAFMAGDANDRCPTVALKKNLCPSGRLAPFLTVGKRHLVQRHGHLPRGSGDVKCETVHHSCGRRVHEIAGSQTRMTPSPLTQPATRFVQVGEGKIEVPHRFGGAILDANLPRTQRVR